MTSEALAPAYVLHARKYRDTSLIVELLTRDEGRISAVVRGARSPQGRRQGNWQPFSPLLMSTFGRSELRTLKRAEFLSQGFSLVGESLLLGLYVNELLVRLLGKFEALPRIFTEYQLLLAIMADSECANLDRHAALRRFELTLLTELGYGLCFDTEAGTDVPVEAGAQYRFTLDRGFSRTGMHAADGESVFAGEDLLALAADTIDSVAVERSARRITRAALAGLLGNRPLKSRELFRRATEGS